MSTHVEMSEMDGVAVVRLTRPEVRNAIGPEQARALRNAIDAASALAGVHALILTGGSCFCAGGDLKAILALVEGQPADAVEEHIYTDFQAVARALRDCPIPTIAAVDGPAIGLGLDLALWCDVRFLAPTAKVAQGWAALGLVPGIGGAKLLQRASRHSMWLMLAQPPLDGHRAAELGIGSLVDDPMQAALQLTQRWKDIGRDALRGYAALGRDDLPTDEYLRKCANLQAQLLTSPLFLDRTRRFLRG